MKVIGITGGVGAGKSTILDYLEKQYQAYILKADEIGHLVMEPGQACYEAVLELFGKDIRKSDKTIDRRKVSDIVFSEAESLERLNAVIHPAVKQYIRNRLEEQRGQFRALAVVEAALLLEDHYEAFCDQVWYVHTEKEVRIRRLMESRGYTRQKAEDIIASQATEEFFRSHADYVIENSGDFEKTCREIQEGIRKL